MYVYLSRLRPVSIGTYPKPGMERFENWDRRMEDKQTGIMAWGKLYYSRELTEKEVHSYDLYYCESESIDTDGGMVYTTPEEQQEGVSAMPRKFTQKQLEYIADYDRENTVQVKLKLNTKTDSDILERLASVPNKQGYIKALIRADMRK